MSRACAGAMSPMTAGSPSANYFGLAVVDDVSAGAASWPSWLLRGFFATCAPCVSFLAASVVVGCVSSAAMALNATKTTAARAAAIVRIIVKLLRRAPAHPERNWPYRQARRVPEKPGESPGVMACRIATTAPWSGRACRTGGAFFRGGAKLPVHTTGSAFRRGRRPAPPAVLAYKSITHKNAAGIGGAARRVPALEDVSLPHFEDRRWTC